MNLAETLLHRVRERRAIDAADFPIATLGFGSTSKAGKTVTPDTALELSAVYASIALRANVVASFPMHAMRSVGGGREPVNPQPAWLDPNRGQPNPETTRFELMNRLETSLCTHGNAYLFISEFDRFAYPSELWNLHPDDVRVSRVDGKIVYTLPDGRTYDRFSISNPGGRVLHIKEFDSGGLTGLSPIRKEAVGLGLAQEEYAAKFFSEGAQADGIIEAPGTASPEKIKKLRTDWEEFHKGSDKSRRVGVLTGGATWKQTSIPNDDAQFIESRQFTVVDIARMFQVPANAIQATEKTTSWGSGIEEINRMWLTTSIGPKVVKLEQALSACLPRGQYVRIATAGLLRADIKARFEAYNIGRNGGWITGDEIRTLEDMNPAGLGDYWKPLAMGTAPSQELSEKVKMAAALVAAGFDPESVTRFLDLPLTHTGDTGKVESET